MSETIYEYFIDNKYTQWYYQIINKANSENRKKLEDYNSQDYIYYEKHHIIPKCKPFNGNYRKENLVLLTFREHFMCHWLLTKMCIGERKSKMFWALTRMAQISNGNKRIVSSWQYEITKMASIKAQIGKKMPQETKNKISKSKTGTKLTKEHCQAISDGNQGQKRSQEFKDNNARLHLGLKHKQESKDIMAMKHSKRWLIIWPDGHEEEIINLHKFCKEHGLNTGNMANVARGLVPHHKGFRCIKLN